MGCVESVSNDEICLELYRYLLVGDHEKLDAALNQMLWETGNPRWQYLRNLITTQFRVPEVEWRGSLLHHAVRLNDAKALSILTGYEPTIDGENSNGNTPLHTACVVGSSAMVVSILLKDAPNLASVVNQRNDLSETALHMACRNHFGWIVELLLAMPEVRWDLLDREDRTPFQLLGIADVATMPPPAPASVHPTSPLSGGDVHAQVANPLAGRRVSAAPPAVATERSMVPHIQVEASQSAFEGLQRTNNELLLSGTETFTAGTLRRSSMASGSEMSSQNAGTRRGSEAIVRGRLQGVRKKSLKPWWEEYKMTEVFLKQCIYDAYQSKIASTQDPTKQQQSN